MISTHHQTYTLDRRSVDHVGLLARGQRPVRLHSSLCISVSRLVSSADASPAQPSTAEHFPFPTYSTRVSLSLPLSRCLSLSLSVSLSLCLSLCLSLSLSLSLSLCLSWYLCLLLSLSISLSPSLYPILIILSDFPDFPL